ncbi:MAG: acyl carrier protein [Clostridiales bacterium]|nr:acyl carrier protein [Clostridiales bacterium]
MSILEELQDIFRDIFDDEELVISEETSAADIDDWDSLVNIQLMVTICKHFDVRMTTQEISGFENVGDIVDCIKGKIG